MSTVLPNEPDLGLLRKHWGFNSLRPHQEQVIRAALSGRDSMALLPTGGGKSLCFQLPALQLPGVCMVISPLVALMQDQVESLRRLGIRAFGLFGSISPDDLIRHMDNIRQGTYKLVYLSPERLRNPLLHDQLHTLPLSLIAVDEAHCISQWGHDFRPAYRHIHLVREQLPSVPVMALTATATEAVIRDVEEQLRLRQPVRVCQSFARPNLSIRVAESEDKWGELLYWLEKVPGTAIVYVGSRKRAERIASMLKGEGISAEGFHGGMDIDTRKGILDRWLSGRTRIAVATSAFGMGIDKPDVRLVIHSDLPDSLENYYQEAGRAGRDGKASVCILLKNSTSFREQQNQYLESLATFEQIEEVYRKLTGYLQIPLMEGEQQEYELDFNAFCLRYELSPLPALDALKSLERHELIEIDTQGIRRSTLRIVASRADLRSGLRSEGIIGPIIEALLRNYGGVFDADVEINEWSLARSLELDKAALIERLRKMESLGLIRYRAASAAWKLYWKHPREDLRTLRPIREPVRKYLEGKRGRLAKMQALLAESGQCRQQYIMEYFDQRSDPCGNCDVCDRGVRTSSADTRLRIVNALSAGPRGSRELASQTGLDRDELLAGLRRLLALGEIGLSDGNLYFLKESSRHE